MFREVGYEAAEGWAEKQYVFAAGFAELPKGTTAHEAYRIVAFVMVVDSRTDIIVDAEFSFALPLTGEFVRSLVIGQNVMSGLEEIQDRVRTRFLAPAQGALLQAVRSAFDRYREWKVQKQ
ncbi:DUF3870 domain-containing protein [Kyrpidia spormannii]|uniref:DUF3870 domain-containing protein n=1 Tax=Kyrpidia spormannii TaxID=2055160 RepID=A0A2K8N6G2_9BACL|nr:DUF3870 domain-containing protein [Kyrpidia spormannii]ATY84916.1 DUF3870 domain-containing protein [Kyrpidia spormannii]